MLFFGGRRDDRKCVWRFAGYSTSNQYLLFVGLLESNGRWGYTPNAYIFSISNVEKLAPFVSKVKRAEYAIYRWPYFGPMFGYDVYITNDANSGTFSFAQLGEDYSVPAVVQNRKTILAGTLDFSPDEVEVFYLDHTQ